MRKTGLLGIILICSLSTVIPVRAAAETPASLVTEVTLESEAASNTGSTEEETVSSEAVSETETDAAAQEAAPDVQVPKEDGAELSADSAADPAPVDGPGQKDGTSPVEDTEQKNDAAPVEGTEQKSDAALVEDTEQKNDAALIENTDLKDNTAPVESTDQKDSSALSEDIPITDASAAEAAGVTISAEPVPASDEQAPLAAAAENAVSSVSSKAAANLAEEMTKDRIHFITLNGVYSASDAILIESNGKYGLIDSSNPSSASGDPNLVFTREYLDAAANGQTVVKYLTDLDISHLEFVLATHSHSDHIGGMPDIANSGLVNSETVYIYKEYSAIIGQEDFHNDYYADLARDAMSAQGAALLNVLDSNLESKAKQALNATLKRDTTDEIGTHLEFTFGDFLIKLFNLHTASTVNENLNSIITTVQKGSSGAGALLMADMEMDDYMESRTVNAIIRNDVTFRADVYKAGHHGYSSSNSHDTINALKPVNCVVSTNRLSTAVDSQTYYNYFVEKNGGKVYRTSENGPALIAEFGDRKVSMLRPVAMNATAAAVPWKAAISDGWKTWYPDDDSFNRTGVKWVYFRSGSPSTGWFKVGSRWYYADDNYDLMTGWFNSGDIWYFLGAGGAMQTGWVFSDGKWYYFSSSGVMQTGWVSSGGKWYLMGSDGAMLTGRQMFDGKTYFFNDSGVMQTGWYKYGGNWFFLSSSGVMQTGWVSSGGKWYLMGSDGEMLTGRQMFDGKTYFFNDSGVMQTGWVSSDGKWYYFSSSGVMQTGWVSSGGKWYLLGSDGAALTGWQTDNNKIYFFNNSGVMQTGWVSSGGKWYYLDSKGAMQTGWITINGIWYLLGSDGVMLKGWQAYNGNIYFFSGGGAMQTGWASSNGRWYYLSSSGILQTGWIKYNGKWYYLESNGVMAADKWIGDYYVKSDGTMAINEWIGPYYVGADGKWIKGYKATA